MAASLPNARVGAIIVAAGASSRMGAAGDKTLADLAGEPLIARTVDAFERCDAVSCVALVVSERNSDAVAALREAKGWRKTLPPVIGGARRRDSVRAGLEALPDDCGWVVVHDGARPFVTPALIEAGIEAAHPTGAAVAVVPAFDTVKRVAPDGSVAETLDRAELRMAQTPQVFRRDVLERAHAEVADDATDDAAMAERVGVEVRTFAGDRGNIKITTAEDLGVGGIGNADAELEVARMVESEMSTASMIGTEHSSELDIVNTALDRTLQMMKALSPFNPPSDIDEARFNLAVRSLKYMRSSIVCIERGYYEASLSLLRSVMEHLLIARDLNHTETISKLKIGKSKNDVYFRFSKIRDRVIRDPIERDTWQKVYARLCNDVHPSGAYRQQISVRDGYKASTGSYYYSHAVSFGLLSLAYQLLDLMELVQEVTIMARRTWTPETDEAYRSLRGLYELLLPQFTSQSKAEA